MTRGGWTALTCLVTLACLPACGGDASAPTAGSETPSLTLSGKACTYTGPRSVPAGALSITVENKDALGGGFELLRLADGATAEDLSAYVAGQRRRLAEGRAAAGRPPFATLVDRVLLAARWNGNLAGDVTAGTYGLTCFVGPPLQALHVAAALDVTG